MVFSLFLRMCVYKNYKINKVDVYKERNNLKRQRRGGIEIVRENEGGRGQLSSLRGSFGLRTIPEKQLPSFFAFTLLKTIL